MAKKAYIGGKRLISLAPDNWVRSLLPQGGCNIKLMADTSGMGLGTFQRRLVSEGLVFERLVDQIRFDEATRLLRGPTIKIVEIA